MKLRSSLKLFAVAAFLLTLTVMSATAGQINGSLALNGISVTQAGGADLSSSLTVTSTSTTLSGGIGDFSGVLGPFTGTTITFANIAIGGGFTFTDALDGTFTATSGTFITPRTATNADMFLLGTFTPFTGAGSHFSGASCAVCVVTGALAHVSLNQTGTAVSEAITITAPASALPGAPEPATLTLFGSALVGLGLFGRKRFTR